MSAAAHLYPEDSISALQAQVIQLKRELAQARAELAQAHSTIARYRQREAEQRNIFAAKAIKDGTKLSLLEVLRHVEQDDSPTDADGRKRICLKTMEHHIGRSDEAIGRDVQKLADLGLIDKHAVKGVAPDGMPTTTLFVAPIPEKIRAIRTLTREETGNKWGGLRCPGCGSHRVRKEVTTKTICLDCGNVSIDVKIQEPKEQPDNPGPGGEPEPQDAVSIETPVFSVPSIPQDAAVLKQESPPIPQDAVSMAPSDKTLQDAATILQWLAGMQPHIAMQPSGNKYIEIKHPLTQEEALAHLSGGRARGATKRKDAAYIRGIIFDADNASDAATLRAAGETLAAAGYRPLWETSPSADHAGGGHLILLFDKLVSTQAAYAHVYSVAPDLCAIKEHWPNACNMRLPGGYYKRPEASGWCVLTSLVTGERASDGREASALLVSHQTPAAIVPELPPESPSPTPAPEPERPGRRVLPMQPSAAPAGSGYIPDMQSREIAEAFNQMHTLEDIHPLMTRTHALAIWRGDREPSVQYNQNGRWFDYGNHGEYPQHGDAFDLWLLVNGKTKREGLREQAKDARIRAEIRRARGG